MSASREKKSRQESLAGGYVDPRTKREKDEQAKDRRTNALYIAVAVIFVIVGIVVTVANSKVIERKADALTIGNETYTAADVSYFYNTIYSSFVSKNSYYLSAYGLDTTKSLKEQSCPINDGTWYEYFRDQAITSMTSYSLLAQKAEAEGFDGSEAVELGRFDWAVNTYTPGCVVLSGSDDPDSPYTLIDLASGESIGVQRRDTDYRSGNVAVLTTDNILKVYDGTTGALLTDVEAAPVEEAQYISVTALPDGYALLQYDDENYNTIAIQTYGGEGLLWSSAGEAQQYTYASYLTSTASGPLLTACRDNRDGSSLYDVLDMEGNLLLRRLGSCYSPDDLPDDCFIARQGFDYGLMDSTGQWLYRESIFSSPSDDAGGGYLY